MFLFGLIALALGLFHLLAPQFAWFLSIGWKLRNAEPSDAYIALNRIGGGIGSLIGVICVITAFVTAGHAQRESTKWLHNFELNLSSDKAPLVTSPGMNLHQIPEKDVQSILSSIKDAEVADVSNRRSTTGLQSFSAQGELDLRFGDGTQATVFYMGSDQFAISRDGLAPDYTFESPSLEVWWSQQK